MICETGSALRFVSDLSAEGGFAICRSSAVSILPLDYYPQKGILKVAFGGIVLLSGSHINCNQA
jgi:hypothetical protein